MIENENDVIYSTISNPDVPNTPLTTVTSRGYEYETCDKGSAEDFKCPLCLMLMKECVEISCGHILCRGCLEEWEELKESSQQSHVCPRCQTVYNKSRTYPSKALDRLITSSVKVKCTNSIDGCPWTGFIADIEVHLNSSCNFVLVSCSNEGCREQLQKHSLKKHKMKCVYRSVSCIFCKTHIIRHTLEEHLKNCAETIASAIGTYPLTSHDSIESIPASEKASEKPVEKFKNEGLDNKELVEIQSKKDGTGASVAQQTEQQQHLKTSNDAQTTQEKLQTMLKDLQDELKVIKQQRFQTDMKFRELERKLASQETASELNNKVHNDRIYFRISALDVHSQFCSITNRRMKCSLSEEDMKKYENDIRNELIRLELKGEQESDVLKELFLRFHRKYDSAVKYQKPCELFQIQDLLMIIDMLQSYRSKSGDEMKRGIINKILTLLMNENGDVPWFYRTFINYYYEFIETLEK